MKVVENDFVKFWIENDILFNSFKIPTTVTLENAKEMIALRHEISNNEKQYWCFSLFNFKSFTKEGRDYTDIHGQDFLFASAAVVNSHVTMYIVNIFIKIKTVTIPFKAFTTKEKAIAWLNELRESAKAK
jgi:hypothetical protein